MKTNKLVNASILKSLAPIRDIPENAVDDLADHTYYETLTKDEYLFTNGTNDPWAYYILSGNIDLIYPDGRVELFSGGSIESQEPLVDLKPRPASAKAANDVIFIRFKSDVISTLKISAITECVSVERSSINEEDIEAELLKEIDQANKTDKLIVPGFPDIVMKVQDAVKDPDGDTNMIIRLIQADPSLAARIVRVANSPIYRGQSAITNLRMAVSRLGIKVTRETVMSFSLQQVFTSDFPALHQKMNELWRYSTMVAAISAILARLDPKLDADRAWFAGLIHNIGALPVLAYAENYPQLRENTELLDTMIGKLSRRIGESVLRRWQFDSEFVTVVRDCRDWMRDPAPSTDYCDIVLLAQLFACLETSSVAEYPAIDMVPAYSKLPFGRLGPKMTVKVPKEARAYTGEIQQILQG